MNIGSSQRAWGRIRLELLAAGFAATLIGIAIFAGFAVERRTFKTSGSDLDIRLIAVRPDAGDELYNAAGEKIGPSPYEGGKLTPWGDNVLRRDFLFDVPPGTGLQPAGYRIRASDKDNLIVESFSNREPVSGSHYTLETTFRDLSWHRRIFSRSARPVEFVDVTLSFYLPERTELMVVFPGPFTTGQTNVGQMRTQVWWKCDLVFDATGSGQSASNTAFHMFSSIPSLNQLSLTFLDVRGVRHFPQISTVLQTGMSCVWTGTIAGVLLESIVAAEIHGPREKTFHNIRVRYPDRPARTGPEPRAKPGTVTAP